METSTCEALVAQALALLDADGRGASAAACHLQAALDALRPDSRVRGHGATPFHLGSSGRDERKT